MEFYKKKIILLLSFVKLWLFKWKVATFLGKLAAQRLLAVLASGVSCDVTTKPETVAPVPGTGNLPVISRRLFLHAGVDHNKRSSGPDVVHVPQVWHILVILHLQLGTSFLNVFSKIHQFYWWRASMSSYPSDISRKRFHLSLTACAIIFRNICFSVPTCENRF